MVRVYNSDVSYGQREDIRKLKYVQVFVEENMCRKRSVQIL